MTKGHGKRSIRFSGIDICQSGKGRNDSMDEKKIIHRYLKEIDDQLTCPRHLKTVLRKELKEDISLFQSPDQALTMEMLYEKFGAPKEIANSFFDRKDYEELLHRAKNRALCWKIISLLIMIILIAIIVFLLSAIRDGAGTITVTNPI